MRGKHPCHQNGSNHKVPRLKSNRVKLEEQKRHKVKCAKVQNIKHIIAVLDFLPWLSVFLYLNILFFSNYPHYSLKLQDLTSQYNLQRCYYLIWTCLYQTTAHYYQSVTKCCCEMQKLPLLLRLMSLLQYWAISHISCRKKTGFLETVWPKGKLWAQTWNLKRKKKNRKTHKNCKWGQVQLDIYI